MTEDFFTVRLAGRSWELPHLSFRAIKSIQPTLFRIYCNSGGQGMSSNSLAALSEEDFEQLASATWRAISQVDSSLSFDAFMELPFSVHDLLTAFPSIARAIGLRPRPDLAAPEAPPVEGKSTSTP